jgi:hypothetical protein
MVSDIMNDQMSSLYILKGGISACEKIDDSVNKNGSNISNKGGEYDPNKHTTQEQHLLFRTVDLEHTTIWRTKVNDRANSYNRKSTYAASLSSRISSSWPAPMGNSPSPAPSNENLA